MNTQLSETTINITDRSDSAQLDLLDSSSAFWKNLESLLTNKTLDPISLLEDLREWINCDALMIVCRENIEREAEPSKWNVGYCCAKTNSVINWEELCGKKEFQSLLNFLEKRTRASQKDRQSVYEDYEPKHVAQEINPDLEAIQKLYEYQPSELDNLDNNLGPIGVFLLGNVNIVSWELGESMLVIGNEFSQEDREKKGVRYFENHRPCFIILCVYLAEVNAHYWRKSRIDTIPLPKREKLLQDKKDKLLQESYIRSVERLAPILEESNITPKLDSSNLGMTVENLSLIEAKIQEEDGAYSDIDKKVNRLGQEYNCRWKDSKIEKVTTEEKDRRSVIVKAMWEWARLVLKVSEQINKYLETPQTSDYKELEKDVQKLVEDAKRLLYDLPSVLWASRENNLTLNGQSLTAFFLTKIVEWRKATDLPANSVLGGEMMGVGDTLRYLKHLGHAVQVALGARTEDATTLQSLLWLVCEFGHEALNLDRRIDLERHLGLAAMEQPALFGLKRFYRDHLNHVIQVCLTGWLLMETSFSRHSMFMLNRRGLLGREVERYMKTDRFQEVLAQWFFASLLHDIGYVIEVGKGWTTLLEQFHTLALSNLKKSVNEQFSNLTSEALRVANWDGANEDTLVENHGVVSAIHARQLLEDLGKKRFTGDFTHAIRAIARHGHWRPTISFSEDPLGVMLILSDELQEWDRPWMELDRAALALSTVPVYKASAELPWHEPLESVNLNIQASWDNDKLSLKCNQDVLDCTLRYREDVHRQEGIFSAWLGRTSNLQRVILKPLDIDFRYRLISYVSPPKELPRRRPSEPQLERLRRLVREERVWEVENWIPSQSEIPDPTASKRDKGVEYKCFNDKGEEIVILNVTALSEKPPIIGSMDNFWKAVERWSGARDSQELTI